MNGIEQRFIIENTHSIKNELYEVWKLTRDIPDKEGFEEIRAKIQSIDKKLEQVLDLLNAC